MDNRTKQTRLMVGWTQCYFFTVEFGLCKEDGALKVYGAGLLSSIAELSHALSPEARHKIKPFDPDVTGREQCLITSFQNSYFYTESFEEAKERMRSPIILLPIKEIESTNQPKSFLSIQPLLGQFYVCIFLYKYS